MHKHFSFPLACLSFNLSMQRPVWDHPRSNLHQQHQRAASFFNTWLGARVDLKVLCHLPFNPVHVEMVQNCSKISQGQRKMREIPLIPPCLIRDSWPPTINRCPPCLLEGGLGLLIDLQEYRYMNRHAGVHNDFLQRRAKRSAVAPLIEG